MNGGCHDERGGGGAGVMTWVRIDDNIVDHPKMVEVGHRGLALFVASLCYASKHLTDGFIPKSAVPGLLPDLRAPKTADALVRVGLWDRVDSGYQVHDYLEYQPSAEDVRAKREKSTRRQSLFRNQGLRQAVRARDGDRCRYCGRPVRWEDRKGPAGGTYDHVDPDRGNDIENLVVACRGCNSAKGGRTPESAGMQIIYPESGPVSKSDLDRTYSESTENPTQESKSDLDHTNPPNPSQTHPIPYPLPGGGDALEAHSEPPAPPESEVVQILADLPGWDSYGKSEAHVLAWLDGQGIGMGHAVDTARALKAKWGGPGWRYRDPWATFQRWVKRPPLQDGAPADPMDKFREQQARRAQGGR